MELRDFTYTYPGGNGYALSGVTLDVRPGECHVITGPTGSGKSTLALALKGILPGSGQSDSRGVGIVLQNPQTQLLASTVGAEAAFGLENLGVPPDRMPGMVQSALGRVGFAGSLGQDPRTLSMGEKYRLLIAAQLVMGRRLIVLDEPSGQLDGQGLCDLVSVISSLKRSGVSLVVCEHSADTYSETADVFWRMQDGALTPASYAISPSMPSYANEKPDHPGNGPVIAADGLCLRHEGGTENIWDGMDLLVCPGSRVAVVGANGVGKTTLLRCITGAIKPSGGSLTVLGGEPALSRLRGRVGMMLQDSDAQVFDDTVLDEVSFSMRRLGVGRREAERTAGENLERFGISGLSGQAPHRLSYGQKRLVCLASVMSVVPELILLDAPLTGLDHVKRALVLDSLHEFSLAGGTVIATSHEPRELEAWSNIQCSLGGGTLAAKAA